MKPRFARCSRLYQQLTAVPKTADIKASNVPKSQKLMLDVGVIRQLSNGLYSLLPLGMRAYRKLESIVSHHMDEIGGQRILLPALTSASLWKMTGRWDSGKAEMFRLLDRHSKEYLLSPTHEEAMASLVGSADADRSMLSHRDLPLLLYQISQKYRDEIKPRAGLIRAREFIMKDLYSFDRSGEEAEATYSAVLSVYRDIMRKELCLPHIVALGDGSSMGGTVSHEIHIASDIGEDSIILCPGCRSGGVNRSLVEGDGDSMSSYRCPSCDGEITPSDPIVKCIEVGHAFLLGTKYSEPLHVRYIAADNSKELVHMGSYGLGLSRLLAAAVEVLSIDVKSEDSRNSGGCIRWPMAISPYTIAVIPPKMGSKEESSSRALVDAVFKNLTCYGDDVIVDDRMQMTIGRRLLDCNRTGYPVAVVIGGKSSTLGQIEIHDVYQGSMSYIRVEDLVKSIDNILVTGERSDFYSRAPSLSSS